VTPLPINVNQDIENVEEDIREYLGVVGSPNNDHLAYITSAKIIEAAIDRLKAAIDNQTTVLNTAINLQTTTLETAINNNTDAIDNQTDTLEAAIDRQTVEHATIAVKQTVMADKQTAMETYQKKLKELGEGPGIHVIGPYEWLGLLSIYRLLVEQGKILDTVEAVSPEEQQKAFDTLVGYLAKFGNIPTSY
jgi:hypothetical protein